VEFRVEYQGYELAGIARRALIKTATSTVDGPHHRPLGFSWATIRGACTLKCACRADADLQVDTRRLCARVINGTVKLCIRRLDP